MNHSFTVYDIRLPPIAQHFAWLAWLSFLGELGTHVATWPFCPKSNSMFLADSTQSYQFTSPSMSILTSIATMSTLAKTSMDDGSVSAHSQGTKSVPEVQLSDQSAGTTGMRLSDGPVVCPNANSPRAFVAKADPWPMVLEVDGL